MRNVFRALFVVMILSLGITATAHAQWSYDPSDPNLEVMYQDYGDQSGTGANVYYCAAKGRWGGYCRACTTVYGVQTCGDSKYSAKCECSGRCNPYKGTCSYEQ
jgi:hypothetical protein